MKDQFVNLHLHSTHSYVDGYGTAEQYIKRAKEINQMAIGLTDHGNVSNHYKWYKEASKNGIKPILGCELYINPGDYSGKNYFHMTVLAINQTGYRNLLSLLTKGWQEGFKRKPLVLMEDLIAKQEGLVVTSGCLSGKISVMIREDKIDEARWEIIRLKNAIKHFYIEVTPLHFYEAKGVNGWLYQLAKETETPMVATMDCHYVHKDENHIQEILLCIQSNDLMSNPNRWKFDQDDFYLKTRKEMEESFKISDPELDFTEALDNTVKIAEMVNFEFPTATALKFPIPDSEKKDLLISLCRKGMDRLGFTGKPQYEDRLSYEFDLIVKKNYVDYFLVVGDMVEWAKSHGILVGPGRGSAAGSLMCYLMRITEVDPIKWGLIFERFIDINRFDPPDIDVDFEDERRPDIKRYLESKYGIDKVSAIATFATFKGKNIIQDFGRIYKIPFAVTDKLKSVLIERSGGDSRASFTLADTLEQFEVAKEALLNYPVLKDAPKLEGQLRNISSHASGIIISNEPLTDFCAVYKKNDENVISIDYSDASALGLLKLDILGLNTLTCVNKALKYVKERTGEEIDIYHIPLDDPKVYDGFNDPKKLFGIFQFDGQAVNQVCRQIKPRNFEELSAINALSRPGPMHGIDKDLNIPITTMYIQRKDGTLPLTYPHPLLEPITKETQGVVIYQEQVMRTMREVGKMSWKDTADIRKLISKSRGVEAFAEYKEKFAIGARENGLTEHEIDNIWDAMSQHGSWSFNKSHSVSYSIISYWTMWLKVYHPIEYYAAMCSTIAQEDKVKKIIKEYKREGFKLLPIDINKSKESFTIDGENMRLGFEQLKGIGGVYARNIIKGQPYTDIDDFKKRAKGIGKSKIELLNKFGAFDSIGTANKEIATLFGDVRSSEYRDSATFEERIELCPLSVEFNALEQWTKFIEKNIKFPVVQIEKLDPNEYSQVVMGIVYDKNLKDKVEEALTLGKEAPDVQDGLSKYCNFVLEDDSDFMTVRIPPRTFPRFKKLIFEETSETDIIMIKGKMGSGIRMMFANEIISLNQLKKKLLNNEKLTESEMILTGKLQSWKKRY